MDSRFSTLSAFAACGGALGGVAAAYGLAVALGLFGPNIPGIDPYVLQMRELSAVGVATLGVVAVLGAAALRVLVSISGALHAGAGGRQP